MVPLRMLYVMFLTYIFEVTNFEMLISRKRRASENAQVRVLYFPSNGTIANVVLNYLGLNFQGQSFQVAISTSKRWKMQILLLSSNISQVFAIKRRHCGCRTARP